MSVISKLQGAVAGAFLSASLLFAPAPADAMPVKTFDQMSANDQGRYVALLVGESMKFMWDHGARMDIPVVLDLFKASGDGKSQGIDELLDILRGVRELEQINPEKTHHVEQVMAILLKRHGIKPIPMKDFMQFAKDFQPEDKGFAENKAPSKPAAAVQGSDEFKLAKN